MSNDLPNYVMDACMQFYKVIKPKVEDADNWVRLIPIEGLPTKEGLDELIKKS